MWSRCILTACGRILIVIFLCMHKKPTAAVKNDISNRRMLGETTVELEEDVGRHVYQRVSLLQETDQENMDSGKGFFIVFRMYGVGKYP